MDNKPIHKINLRTIRATIWCNDGQHGPWYSVEFSRSYKDTRGEWKDTDSFSGSDLVLLGKVADLAHTWICEQAKADRDQDASDQVRNG